MKSKGLTFGVRDKIARLSAWGLAKVALSGAIPCGIASLHANSVPVPGDEKSSRLFRVYLLLYLRKLGVTIRFIFLQL